MSLSELALAILLWAVWLAGLLALIHHAAGLPSGRRRHPGAAPLRPGEARPRS